MISGTYCKYSQLSQQNNWQGQVLASVVGELSWLCQLDWIGARFSFLNAVLFWCYVLSPSRGLRFSLSSTSHYTALCGCLDYVLVSQMAPRGDVGDLNRNQTCHGLHSGSGVVVYILTLNMSWLVLGIIPYQQDLTASVSHWQTLGNFPLRRQVFCSGCPQLDRCGTETPEVSELQVLAWASGVTAGRKKKQTSFSSSWKQSLKCGTGSDEWDDAQGVT